MAHSGIVTSFCPDLGYGWIQMDPQGSLVDDVFIHKNQCVGGEPRQGDRVQFDIRTDLDGQTSARRCTGGSAPLSFQHWLSNGLPTATSSLPMQPIPRNDHDDHGDGRTEAATLGLPGFESPSGYQQISRLWHSVNDAAPYFCLLRVVCSSDDEGITLYKGWCIVWWNLQETNSAMMRPELWHTTVLRWEGPKDAPLAARTMKKMQRDMDSIVPTLLATDLSIPLQLCRAPWPKSFNFGLPVDSAARRFCEAIKAVSVILMHKWFPEAEMLEDRPLHIS